MENSWAPAQGEGEVQRIAILVTAQSSSEKAEESFYLELYPEGISVKGAVDGSAVQKGRVRLDTRENKQAASEIKQIRVQIFTLAVEYHTKQAAAEISYANWMNRATYVCAFLDWAGQQAFSYVIKVSYGDVAEMILSPLKNLLVEQTAEYLHAKYWDLEFQIDVHAKLLECFENMAESFLVDALFGEMSADDITAAGKNLWKSATADLGKLNLSDIKGSLMKTFGATTMTDRAKKAAAFVAAFAALNFTKHYCIDDETKNDFGKSIVATLNDCTLTTIKQIFNKYVGKWMGDWLDKPTESKGTRGEMLKGFIGKYFKVEDVKARGMLVENGDAVIFGKKYGFGIQENSLDIVGTQYLEGTIEKLVDNTIGEISGWFWDSEFGGFVVNTTSQVYTIMFGTLIDYLFEWIQGKMDLEGPMMKNRVKVPDYIPPADEESMEKAKRL